MTSLVEVTICSVGWDGCTLCTSVELTWLVCKRLNGMLVVGVEFWTLNDSCRQRHNSYKHWFFASSQKEKERIRENKRQVQSLVNKSKTIVRLKPRNPEEKSGSPIIVQALCDFKQDQVGYLLSVTHTHTGAEYEVKYYKCNSVFPLFVCSVLRFRKEF